MGLPFWSLNRGKRGLLKILNFGIIAYRAGNKTKMTHLLVEFVS